MRPPGKRLNPEDYWFIDGTAYDFSTFKHPGGDIALGLVKGRDATELFRSYHSFTNNHKYILRKYEVEKDFGPQILKKNYAFESEFYNEVRDRVKAVIDQIGTKHADTQRWIHIYVMLLSVLFTGYYFVQGAWWALPLFPICYWILNINTFHDASHFALSSNWRINHLVTHLFPTLCGSNAWYHEHVIGHHVYTNMPHKDPDMHHAPFAWRVSEVTPHIWYMRLQVTYLPVIWGILVFYMRFIVDTLINQTGSYNFIKNHEMSRKDKITNALVSVMTFTTMFFWPVLTDFSLEKKIAFSIIPYVIYSWCFGMATQLNHTTPETMDIAAGADWYEHQCLTSHTFAPQSVFWLIMTGGLNLQVEHHLFPGVNSWHLMKIQPIVEECCKKHGIQYNLSKTATEGVRKYLKQLWRVGNIKSA